MKRRAFLQSSAGVVVGFSLSLSPVLAQQAADPRFAQVDAWLKIAPNGLVTFHTGKVELGTGVRTALAQMIAEELDVAVSSIQLVMGDTDLCPDQIGTFGSLTIMLAGPQVRQAAAEARLALVERAAQRLGVPADQIQTAQGVARAPSGASVSYGELAQGPALGRAISGKATLKAPAQFKQIGQSVPRVEIPAKVCGTHEYVQHVRVPGMLHGRIIRPDMPGATALQIDDSALKTMAGAPKVVRKGNFLAVVADTEDMAIQAAQAVKVLWSAAEPLPTPQEVPQRLRSTPSTARELQRTGRGADTFAQAAKTHQADYFVPFQLHASIGPSCAVADDLDRRIGLLRPKRFRRCIGRRGLAVAAGWQAGAGAMDAPPRAPMGAQGRGHGHVGQRRPGHRWKNCRLGLRGVEPQPRFAPLLRHGWQCVGRRGAGHARALFASRCRSRCQAHLRF